MKNSTVREWFVLITIICAVAVGVYSQREYIGTAVMFGGIGLITGLCYFTLEG